MVNLKYDVRTGDAKSIRANGRDLLTETSNVMKINQKTLNAIKNNKVNTASAKAGKASGKGGKVGKTVAVKKAAKAAYKGITGRAVLLLEGEKGNVFRLVNIDKNGTAQNVQDNRGLRFEGKSIDVTAENSEGWDKETRLHFGAYIASKGNRVTWKVLSLAQAEKLASKKVTFERNGHEITARYYGNADKHYLATIETFKKTGVRHYFQLETERLKTNARHFGAIVKV